MPPVNFNYQGTDFQFPEGTTKEQAANYISSYLSKQQSAQPEQAPIIQA